MFICASSAIGQVVYFEDFGTGCTTGNLATAFGWTNTNVTANQAMANIWYVSAAERGVGPGNCGLGCGGSQSRTLHIGTSPLMFGDLGASYFESDAFTCAFIGWCSITDKRIESPTINCTGISAIPFTFDYIENGQTTLDNGTVWYSANNGTTWTLLDDCPKTALCGAQGLWTTRSLTLPASANNNPTVKIAFRWRNNNDGVGTDPSFAIDNIQVGTPVILEVEMTDMFVKCEAVGNSIHWKTKSEFNADYYSVYTSLDGVNWNVLTTVRATNSSTEQTYFVVDERSISNHAYYYIEEVDMDGKRISHAVLSNENCGEQNSISIYPNPTNGQEITVTSNKNILSVELISVDGKLITTYKNDKEDNALRFFPTLDAGTYFIKIICENETQTKTLVISN